MSKSVGLFIFFFIAQFRFHSSSIETRHRSIEICTVDVRRDVLDVRRERIPEFKSSVERAIIDSGIVCKVNFQLSVFSTPKLHECL